MNSETSRKMHKQFLAGMLALVALAACSSGPALEEEDSTAISAVRARNASLRKCSLPPLATPLATAQACAEWFVARNGFLSDSLKDTTAVARDGVEQKLTMAQVLYSRHKTVTPKATLACNSGGRTAYTVAFAIPGDSIMQIGRTVTMDSAFAHLRVERLPFKLLRASADPNCHKV